MRLYSCLLAVLLTLLLASCGSQATSDVSGNWSGELSSGSSITLQLTQSGSSVEGTVTISGLPATVSGAATGGRLSLTGRDDIGAVSVEARVSATSMEGNYSAFDPAANAPISVTFTASR